MPNLAVVDMEGKNVGTIELAESVFGIEPNAAVMHQMVVNYLAAQRQGTQSALTRSEVSGGGKKPWRQKGTGRARQGSTRAPQWTHGGVALGPKPRKYKMSLNKKVKRIAMCSALSDKVAGGNMVVVDSIKTDEYKTRVMVDMLKAVGAGKKSLVVLADGDAKVIKSFANIEGVKTASCTEVNVYDILNADTFVVAADAAKKLEEVFA